MTMLLKQSCKGYIRWELWREKGVVEMADKERSTVMNLDDIIQFVNLKKRYYGQINSRTITKELSEILFLLVCYRDELEEKE